MVQGSWVGDPLLISFFLFSSVFLFCSSFPMSASVTRDGVECFTLCLNPFPFLHSSHFYFLLVSLLGVGVRRSDRISAIA